MLPDRFMQKVKVTENCWLWLGANVPKGYGIYNVNRKNVYAHRFAWSEINGEIPEGMVICHKCDNPSCVNPLHLFMGTQKDNLNDMWEKGRGAKGDRHRTRTRPDLILRGEQIGNSKLTQAQVNEIRSTYQKGKPGHASEFSLTGLARKYGVGFQQISRIINNKRWV